MKLDLKLLFGAGVGATAAVLFFVAFFTYQFIEAPVIIPAVFILLGIGILTGGAYMLHSIYQPINTLVDIIQRVSHGELDVEVPVEIQKREDEIGDLATSLNSILASLKLAIEKAPEGKDTGSEFLNE